MWGPRSDRDHGTVMDMVAEWVRREPAAEAVAFDGVAVTYGEVWAAAEQVARTLASLGAGPGTPVGLCLDRSIELVVAIIGIMRAGCVCVPLDVAYPADRLAYMCQDAAVEVVVGTAARIAGLGTMTLLAQEGSLSYGVRGGLRRIPVAPLPAVSPGGPAYLVYTSGSTGRPKGVRYEHENIANLVGWQIAASAAPPGARTLQFSPASFDITFQEIYSALGAGGTVVCCDEDDRLDPGLLWDLVETERINRLFLPFVMIQSLALFTDEADPARHPLREIITAGEQVQCGDKIRALFARLPGCRLVNQWGTTETHVATSYVLPPDVSAWPLLAPIGTPIANTHVHVCDAEGGVLPDGRTGELWIAGTAVGPGYLNLPDRTRKAYVPDPCGAASRAYRTGDLGRVDGGTLVFLGRMDHQVKVRGFRIELGEIETLIDSVPGVAEVVVAVVGADATEKYLHAFVVLRADADPMTVTGAVWERLRGKLPDYMLPSRLDVVTGLPRTPSGKLDRKAVAETALSIVTAPAAPVT
ncbi:amino acid adenylation domain-containing protein [Amycolatopsis sp. NPDC051716]|uniref:amino acid adenylation domain-containing protein n=1 Tax=Amycolatopsis sp. NPDC051716 TaxID=3155804 RepID=UPI00344A7575